MRWQVLTDSSELNRLGFKVKGPRLFHKYVSHRGTKTGSDIVLPEKKKNPGKEGERWTGR